MLIIPRNCSLFIEIQCQKEAYQRQLSELIQMAHYIFIRRPTPFRIQYSHSLCLKSIRLFYALFCPANACSTMYLNADSIQIQ